MNDYSFSGLPADVAAAVVALWQSGVTDFAPAMEFDGLGNLLSTPPTDALGTAYIRVRAAPGLATPVGLTVVSATAAIPYCGVWLGESQ